MSTEHLVLGVMGMVVVNIVLLKFMLSHIETKRITLVKSSVTGEKIKECVGEWIKRVKTEFLPDGRIKMEFSSQSFSIWFYIQEHKGKIYLSDHGEFMKRIDLSKTVNKSLVDKLDATCGLKWNGKDIYMESTLDLLDENIWNMFSCMVTLENATY